MKFSNFSLLGLHKHYITLGLSFPLAQSKNKWYKNRLYSTHKQLIYKLFTKLYESEDCEKKPLDMWGDISTTPEILPPDWDNTNIICKEKIVANRFFKYINDVSEQTYFDEKYKNKYKKKDGYGLNGIYLVIFRVLNNEKGEIIYKAMYYHEYFVKSIINYLAYNLLINKKNSNSSVLYDLYGPYECLVDSELLNISEKGIIFSYDSPTTLENSYSRERIIKGLREIQPIINSWAIEHGDNEAKPWWIFNELVFSMNLDVLSDLFLLAYEKNALEYMKILWNSEDFLISKGGWVHYDKISQKINTNMLNNKIFLVKNVDLFINKIKDKIKTNKLELKISGPPKPLRHLHNNMDSYLSYFDLNFKLSLHYHYAFHKEYWKDKYGNRKWDRDSPSYIFTSRDFNTKIDELNSQRW